MQFSFYWTVTKGPMCPSSGAILLSFLLFIWPFQILYWLTGFILNVITLCILFLLNNHDTLSFSNTVMGCLTTGILFEKYIVRQFRHCANIIVCTYTYLDIHLGSTVYHHQTYTQPVIDWKIVMWLMTVYQITSLNNSEQMRRRENRREQEC